MAGTETAPAAPATETARQDEQAPTATDMMNSEEPAEGDTANKDAAAPAADVGRARESQDQVKDRYIAAKINEARAYFNELEYDDQTALIKRYNETVGMDKLKVSTAKVPSKMASTNFFRWVVLDTWGQPTAADLLEFLLSDQQAPAGSDGLPAADVELALKARDE